MVIEKTQGPLRSLIVKESHIGSAISYIPKMVPIKLLCQKHDFISWVGGWRLQNKNKRNSLLFTVGTYRQRSCNQRFNMWKLEYLLRN